MQELKFNELQLLMQLRQTRFQNNFELNLYSLKNLMKNRSSGNKFAFHRDSKLSEYRVSIGFVWKHTLCYGHGRYYTMLEETLRSFGKRIFMPQLCEFFCTTSIKFAYCQKIWIRRALSVLSPTARFLPRMRVLWYRVFWFAFFLRV